ncbi:hypothetical protein OVA21_13770 [Dietzia sp. SL131]|uniref:hypothetical protein n=1 Tax=Dietzia sp. SL131 TaxID=2995149 RepID=UPI00227BA526|nr:hypothetical protein [Dietzia sp. SL131]MCY1658253.1 hypothetical protein [Dietzia sp. SL131]
MTAPRMLVLDTNALLALNDGQDQAWEVLRNGQADETADPELAVTSPFVTVAELAALSARAGARGELEACDELAAFAMALLDPVYSYNLFGTTDVRLLGATESTEPRSLLDYTDPAIMQVIVSEPGNGTHDVPVDHPRAERVRRVTLNPTPEDFDVIQTTDLLLESGDDVRLFTFDFGAYRAAQRLNLPVVDQPHFSHTDVTHPRSGCTRVRIGPVDLRAVDGTVIVPTADLLVAVLLGEDELPPVPAGGVLATTLAVAQSAAHRALRRSVRAHHSSTPQQVRAAFVSLVTTRMSIAAVDGRLLTALVDAATEDERWRFGYPTTRPGGHQQVVPIRDITVAEMISSLPESVPVVVVDTTTEPGDTDDLPHLLASDPLRYPLLMLLARRSTRGVVRCEVTIALRGGLSGKPFECNLRDLARDAHRLGRRGRHRPRSRR